MKDPKQNAECVGTSIDRGFYATRPTGGTVFLRTFLPWQLWKFIKINSRMLMLISRSHKSHAPGPRSGSEENTSVLKKSA